VPRYRFGGFTLSPGRRVLVRDGRALPLIPRYFDLLVFLVERRREAVHRQEIFDKVWRDVIVSDSALSQAIRTLRRTLGDDPREPRFIRTVSRHGYQFVFEVTEEEDREEPLPETPIAELVASRLEQAARLTPARWADAALGGATAGLIAGAAGGLLLTMAPASSAPFDVIPVLAVVGGVCGAIGGTGVGAGLSVGEASTQSKRTAALIVGAASGGAVVGTAAQWIARWSLAALFGVTLEVGGGIEGVVVGAAAGLGYAVAPRSGSGRAPRLGSGQAGRPRLPAAAIMAILCGAAALALTSTGRPLVGGTLHALAREARGSQITLTPLARMLGEPDFGPVAQALIGTGEGAMFGLGLAFGLLRRRSSPGSQESLTRF
jgi:DNA-binding winged helix-turn-helix (wHTH) protein